MITLKKNYIVSQRNTALYNLVNKHTPFFKVKKSNSNCLLNKFLINSYVTT